MISGNSYSIIFVNFVCLVLQKVKTGARRALRKYNTKDTKRKSI